MLNISMKQIDSKSTAGKALLRKLHVFVWAFRLRRYSGLENEWAWNCVNKRHSTTLLWRRATVETQKFGKKKFSFFELPQRSVFTTTVFSSNDCGFGQQHKQQTFLIWTSFMFRLIYKTRFLWFCEQKSFRPFQSKYLRFVNKIIESQSSNRIGKKKGFTSLL